MKIRTSYSLTKERVDWGPYSMPRQYTTEVDNEEWPFRAEIVVDVSATGFKCSEAHLTARRGVSLQGADLRLPIAALIRSGAISVAVQKKEVGHWTPLMSDEDVERFYARFRQEERTGGRAPITDERLDEVAEVYRANERTSAPSMAVADALGLSPSYARALVARARKAGKLAPAGKGKN